MTQTATVLATYEVRHEVVSSCVKVFRVVSRTRDLWSCYIKRRTCMLIYVVCEDGGRSKVLNSNLGRVHEP